MCDSVTRQWRALSTRQVKVGWDLAKELLNRLLCLKCVRTSKGRTGIWDEAIRTREDLSASVHIR